MRRELAAALTLLAIGAAVLFSAPYPQKNGIPIRVLGLGKDFPGQLWAHTMMPPFLSFRVKAGKIPERGIVQCSVETEVRELETTDRVRHRFNIIILHCEGDLLLELEGLDLTAGGH